MSEGKKMSAESLKLLMQSLGETIVPHSADPRGVVSILVTETLRFRDKLKEETGVVFTVEDTRLALSGLESALAGKPLPNELTPEQRSLAQIWLDRLTTFK